LRVIQASIYHIPFSDNCFDGIFCAEVLEHLQYPLDALKELHRVLRPGGRIYLATRGPSPDFWDDYTHIRPYTPRSLAQLARIAGFKNLLIEYDSKGIPGFGFLQKIFGRKKVAKFKSWLARHNIRRGHGLIMKATKL
jgi:ubiquinone/menaquinone biosynthesis C-methylase UbiE